MAKHVQASCLIDVDSHIPKSVQMVDFYLLQDYCLNHQSICQVRYVTAQVPGGKLTMPEEYLSLDGQLKHLNHIMSQLQLSQSPGHQKHAQNTL